MAAIAYTEEQWANSHLSIVRHTGTIRIGGYVYIIVDKSGRDIFECSLAAEKEGRDYSIGPGEPADLVREDFVPVYRRIGREGFWDIITLHPGVTPAKAMRIVEESERADERDKKITERYDG